MIRSHDDRGRCNCSQHLFQPRSVLFGHLRKSQSHSQVRIRNANFCLHLDAKILCVDFHRQHGAHRISGSCFDVTAVHADVFARRPAPNVFAFLANLGTGFAFVTRTSAFVSIAEDPAIKIRRLALRRCCGVIDSRRSRRGGRTRGGSSPQCCQIRATIRFLRHNYFRQEVGARGENLLTRTGTIDPCLHIGSLCKGIELQRSKRMSDL